MNPLLIFPYGLVLFGAIYGLGVLYLRVKSNKD